MHLRFRFQDAACQAFASFFSFFLLAEVKAKLPPTCYAPASANSNILPISGIPPCYVVGTVFKGVDSSTESWQQRKQPTHRVYRDLVLLLRVLCFMRLDCA